MPAKAKDVQRIVEKLFKAEGTVDIKQVQRFAGQLSWASGLFPWLTCFNTTLWSAITAHVTEQYYQKWSKKKRPGQLFFVCENPAGAGALTAYTKMDRRQHTVSDDAHRLAHRCSTIRVRRKGVPMVWLARAIGRRRISTCSVQSAATQPGNPSGNYTQHYLLSIRGCLVVVANPYVCSWLVPPPPCTQSCVLPTKS